MQERHANYKWEPWKICCNLPYNLQPESVVTTFACVKIHILNQKFLGHQSVFLYNCGTVSTLIVCCCNGNDHKFFKCILNHFPIMRYCSLSIFIFINAIRCIWTTLNRKSNLSQLVLGFFNLFVNFDGTNWGGLPWHSLLGTVQTVHKTVLLYRFMVQIGKAYLS